MCCFQHLVTDNVLSGECQEQIAELTCSCRGLECTGTLIGPKHVVTAAHCVFDINDSRQYVSSLNFAPGEMSQNSLPFGTAQWSSVRVLSQFTNQVWQLAPLHPVSPRVCPQMLGALYIAPPTLPLILLAQSIPGLHYLGGARVCSSQQSRRGASLSLCEAVGQHPCM